MHTNYVEQTHITWMPSAETSVPFVRRNLWVSTVGVSNDVRDREGTTTGNHTTIGGLDNGRRNAAAAASAVNGIRGVCGIRAATDAGRCCPFAAAAPAICTATTLRRPAVASAATTAAAARVFAHAAIANQGATELGGINGVVRSVSATTGQRTLFRCGHVSGIRTGMLEGATSSCANTVGLTEHLGVGRWF